MERWKQQVRNAANQYWPVRDPPSDDELKLTVTYYYEDTYPDVDNIIKPIQDALIGIAYRDDNQISDTRCNRKNLNGAFKIKGLSEILAKGFVKGKEFLHVKIELDTNQERLS